MGARRVPAPLCTHSPLPLLPPPAAYYFLFHSIWHLCLAEGYLLLYQQLEGVHLQGSCAGTASGASQPADSQADSASSEEEEEASEGEAEVVVAAAAGGWAAALLQPARQLLRFQRRSGSARRGQAADSKAGKAL